MTSFLDAVAFLTRVPVGRGRERAPSSAAVRWFPAVGALLGVTAALTYWAGHWLVGPVPAAAFAVAVPILLTGAFHEDGLADTADAAGGWSREERFRILDDPTHGTYGVLALVLPVVVRVSLLPRLSVAAAFAVLPAGHALSRGVAVALMGLVPPATGEGLGASSVRHLRRADAAGGAAVAAVVTVALTSGWSLPALGAAATVGLGMALYARRTIGGVAGDLLGATQQLADLAVLTVLVAAVHHGAAIPWWR